MSMSCGAATMRLLAQYGIDTVFGIPGVHTLDFCRGLGEGSSIQQQRAAQDFAARFTELSRSCHEADSPEEFTAAYVEIVDWQLRLEEAGEVGLLESVAALTIDLRRGFGQWVKGEYPHWVSDSRGRPLLSVDLVREFLLPHLGTDPVYFVVLDCMRLDQWRAMIPVLS